jgi:hypothetical protein
MFLLDGRRLAWVLVIGASFSVAQAQSFTNGNFETGDLTGWTSAFTTNGASTLQTVSQFDIDGGGPLPTNFAGQFQVGHVSGTTGSAGITLTQNMNLVAGQTYQFHFDWASRCNLTSGSNADGGQYDFIVNNVSLIHQAVGSIPALTTIYGVSNSSFTAPTTATYSVGAMLQRAFNASGSVDQFVDNFTVTPVPEPATIALLGIGAAALIRKRRK